MLLQHYGHDGNATVTVVTTVAMDNDAAGGVRTCRAGAGRRARGGGEAFVGLPVNGEEEGSGKSARIGNLCYGY